MMSNLNAIGYHFVGPFNESERNAYFGLLNDTRPACITVLGGTQFDQALMFAKTCKQTYPETRVIFRHFINKANPRAMIVFEPQAEDTGRWARMSAEMWWDHVGKLYIGTGLTVLPDNESTMADYTPYAAWQAAVMRLAGAEGVGIAYGRFPSWHVAKGREQHLDAMLIEAGKHGDLMTFSPNVYWTADNHDSFNYPGYVTAYAKKLGLTLNVTIGEFAILRSPTDAYHGWRSCGIDSAAYAKQVSELAASKLPGIPVCVYSVGKWPTGENKDGSPKDTFSIDGAFMRYIKEHPTPLKPVPTPPATETPPPPETPPNPPSLPPESHVLLPVEYVHTRMMELSQRMEAERAMIEVRKLALAADEARQAKDAAEYEMLSKALAA